MALPPPPGLQGGSGTNNATAGFTDQRLDLGAEGSIAGRMQIGNQVVGVSYAVDAEEWSTSVVTIQFSWDDLNWFDTAHVLNDTNRYKANVDVTGVLFVRLKVTTAASISSEDATVDYIIVSDSRITTEFGV